MWGWKRRTEGRICTDERYVGDQMIPYQRELKTSRVCSSMEIPGSPVGPSGGIGTDLLRAGPCSSLAAWLFPFYETPSVTSPPASRGKAGRRGC